MMRSKSAGRDLVEFLKTEWPLELDKTYLYEVKMQDKEMYRVFYDEYPSITLGQIKMKQLPESVRVNSPYLHSVYRMQKALL
jgi:septal ring-binding cell division protein DamX